MERKRKLKGLSSKKKNSKKVSFKMFAPEAKKVSLAGDFNNWDMNSHLFKKDSKGFYVDVAWVLAEYCQKDGINYDAIKRRYENASNNSGIALSEVLYR